MKIIFDFKELLLSDNMDVGWADICLKIGEEYYPSRDWNDKIFTVLSEWMYNIINNMSKKEIILNFIDGEYAVKLIKENNGLYNAYFGYWDSFDEIFIDESGKLESLIDVATFYEEILNTNKKLIDFVNINNIQYPYLDHFKKMNKEFKEYI